MYRTRASLFPERLKGLPGASAMLPQMLPPSALHQPMFSAACTLQQSCLYQKTVLLLHSQWGF